VFVRHQRQIDTRHVNEQTRADEEEGYPETSITTRSGEELWQCHAKPSPRYDRELSSGLMHSPGRRTIASIKYSIALISILVNFVQVGLSTRAGSEQLLSGEETDSEGRLELSRARQEQRTGW
jgi:hypothetical protein